MKVVLREPKTGEETEIKNAEIFTSTVVRRRPSECGGYMVPYPAGDPMIVITSNVPEEARKEIEGILTSYCNH
jgi:UDP-N-acetylglucosamine pyrophosphorylase